MKLTRFAAFALSATALAAVSALATVGTPFAAHAVTVSDVATPAQPSVAVYDCQNQPQVRPSTFDFFCDGSGSFTKLHWSTWNASIASGTGVQYLNNCTPNCAAGTWTHRTVDLVFWRSEPVKGHPGQRGYSQMTVLYPGRPVGHDNTYTSAPPGAFPGEF